MSTSKSEYMHPKWVIREIECELYNVRPCILGMLYIKATRPICSHLQSNIHRFADPVDYSYFPQAACL